jgi:hypothetical protein
MGTGSFPCWPDLAWRSHPEARGFRQRNHERPGAACRTCSFAASWSSAFAPSQAGKPVLQSSTAHRPSPILPSAVRGPPSEFVYSFPLFVDGLPPASLKSLSRHRPRSTVRRPSSILPFAVCGPPSEFVYSFPHSLTVSLTGWKARPAVIYRPPSIVHFAVCRPRSAV